MVALLILALAGPPVTDAEREEFLRYGEVQEVARAGQGVTASRRATLQLNGITHDAHVQIVDIQHRPLASFANFEPGFTDSFKYNIAAYELDRLLGLELSPVCVFRPFERKSAAFCWWVDDVQMTEAQRRAKRLHPPDVAHHSRQLWRMRVFDQLIYNTDRNQGNILFDGQWRLWAIDHTRAFRVWPKLKDPDLVTQIDRALLERLRALTREQVTQRTEAWLSRQQIDGLMARRDLILQRIEELVARHGEQAVIFDWSGFGGREEGP